MRALFLLILFLASCSIKDLALKNQPQKSQTSQFVQKIDLNNDGNLSKQEIKLFQEQKKLVNPSVDYYNPLIIFLFILSLIISLCSITYVIDFIKKIIYLIKDKCNN